MPPPAPAARRVSSQSADGAGQRAAPSDAAPPRRTLRLLRCSPDLPRRPPCPHHPRPYHTPVPYHTPAPPPPLSHPCPPAAQLEQIDGGRLPRSVRARRWSEARNRDGFSGQVQRESDPGKEGWTSSGSFLVNWKLGWPLEHLHGGGASEVFGRQLPLGCGRMGGGRIWRQAGGGGRRTTAPRTPPCTSCTSGRRPAPPPRARP